MMEKIKRILFNQTFQLLVCAAIGLGLGIGLSYANVSAEVVSWIALPGDLFLRALKCIVIIMVFTSMILAVVDMVKAGKAFTIGWKTIGMYMLTTVVASLEGLISVIIFQRWFTEKYEEEKDSRPLFRIYCDSTNTTTMQYSASTGAVECVPTAEAVYNQSVYLFEDLNKAFISSSESGPQNDISISDTLQDGIFKKMVSENIIKDFSTGNFLAVICFAILFAIAMMKSKKQNPKTISKFVEETNTVLILMITWIIYLTPLAVISLVAGALAAQDELDAVFKDIGVLVAAGLVGFGFHVFVFIPLLFLLIVRENPFIYMKNIFPAQTFAFASASSAATLPLNIKCAVDSKKVPKTIANFVLSLGATINMDGGAIYFPIAIVFLGVAAGMEFNAGTYVLIILLSTLGSAGTAPVPSASLVLIITAYNTVFGTTGTPEAFGYILVIDWFMDRCRTTVNVTGDNFMSRIISSMEGAEFDIELDDDNNDNNNDNDDDKMERKGYKSDHDGDENKVVTVDSKSEDFSKKVSSITNSGNSLTTRDMDQV